MTELLNEIYLDDRLQREANSKALLLAQARFRAQIYPFIEGRPERLAYAQSEIDRIVIECSAEVDAEVDYVADRFKKYVADAVAVSEPQHLELEFTTQELAEGLPPKKFDPDKENPEAQATTEVTDHGSVLDDEITEPDAKIDLNENTAKASCFRCGGEIEPLVAKVSSVCVTCTADLRNKVGLAPTAINPSSPYTVPVDPNARVECTYCMARGQHFEGTQDEVNQHISSAHQQELMHQHLMPAAKQAAPGDSAATEPVQADEGLSNESNPSHHFDDVIQEMADRAAAQQFSKIDDEEAQAIAQRYGLDPEQVKENVIVTATFGDYTAQNGELTDQTVPDDHTEVELEGMGGRIEAHDAQVPVQLAVDKVAQDLQMKPDLVYNELRDSYGADLGDQYHASVSGEHRFYLPNNMIEVHAKRSLREVIASDLRNT